MTDNISDKDRVWAGEMLKVLDTFEKISKNFSVMLLASSMLGGSYLAGHDHWFGYAMIITAYVVWIGRD